MSIRNEPFEALLDGRKKHEFRRRFSRTSGRFQVVFYVSDPVRAICGVGIFDKPIYDSIGRMKAIARSHRFSSPENIEKYFSGLERGYALPVRKIKRVGPIDLEEIRKTIEDFNPPQSYCRFPLQRFYKLLERVDLYDSPDEAVQRTLF